MIARVETKDRNDEGKKVNGKIEKKVEEKNLMEQ